MFESSSKSFRDVRFSKSQNVCIIANTHAGARFFAIFGYFRILCSFAFVLTSIYNVFGTLSFRLACFLFFDKSGVRFGKYI